MPDYEAATIAQDGIHSCPEFEKLQQVHTSLWSLALAHGMQIVLGSFKFCPYCGVELPKRITAKAE